VDTPIQAPRASVGMAVSPIPPACAGGLGTREKTSSPFRMKPDGPEQPAPLPWRFVRGRRVAEAFELEDVEKLLSRDVRRYGVRLVGFLDRKQAAADECS